MIISVVRCISLSCNDVFEDGCSIYHNGSDFREVLQCEREPQNCSDPYAVGTKTVAGNVVGHVPCLSDCLMFFSIVATINHGVLQPHGHQQKVELLLCED